MAANNFNINGLTNDQVLEARQKYGSNTLEFKKENGFFDALKRVSKEPMVILLLVASGSDADADIGMIRNMDANI